MAEEPVDPQSDDSLTQVREPSQTTTWSEVEHDVATIVATLDGEPDAEDISVVDTAHRTTAIAAEFATPRAARSAYQSLLKAQEAGTLQMDDVVVVHSDAQGRIHIEELADHRTKTGAKLGLMGGIAIGVLFPPALIGAVVSAGAIGAAAGMATVIREEHRYTRELDGAIGASHAGLIVLVHSTHTARAGEIIVDATNTTVVDLDDATMKEIREAALEASSPR